MFVDRDCNPGILNLGIPTNFAIPKPWDCIQSQDFWDCAIPNYSIIIYNFLHKLKLHINWRFRSYHAIACNGRVRRVAGIGVSWRCMFEASNPSPWQNSWQLVHVAHFLPALGSVACAYRAAAQISGMPACIYLLMASLCCSSTKLHHIALALHISLQTIAVAAVLHC
jgi:hypothetical protein